MIRANDPCPCGSGKKYQKCCGGRERAPSQAGASKPRPSPAPAVSTRPSGPPARPSGRPASPGNPKRRELELLAGVLARETGLLEGHPYLLPSHLHNRIISDSGTRSLLSKARRALTGRPWAELCNRIVGIQQATLRVLELRSRVAALAFSPEGTRLATAGSDSQVRLWETATGRQLDELPVELRNLASLTWSTDGRRLAVGGEDGAWVCELASRRYQLYPSGGQPLAWAGTVRAALESGDQGNRQSAGRFEGGSLGGHLTWSPDGSWLASGDHTGTIRIWSLGGEVAEPAVLELGIVTPHRQWAYEVTGLAWAPREPLLAVAARDGTVSFFEPNPWEETARVKFPDRSLGPLAWSPDGRDLLVGCGNVLQLMDAGSSRQLGSLEGMSAWSRISARDLWGTRAPAAPIVTGTFEGHTGFITALACSPGGELCASAAADGTVRLWSLDAMKRSAGTRSRAARETAAPSPLSGGRSFTDVLEADPQQAAELLVAETAQPAAQAGGVPSPDGRWVALGKEDGEIRIRSVEPGQADRVIREGWTEAKAQAYANRPRSPGFIDFTPMIGGHQLRLFDPDYSPVEALAWSPDGRMLAAAGLKLGLEVHDLQSGEVRRCDTGPGYAAIRRLAWSPDGTVIALAEGGRNAIMDRRFLVRLWNPVDGTARTIFAGDGRSALGWAPDSALLAFAGVDGSVRIWSSASERALLVTRCLSPLQRLRFEGSYLCGVDDGAGTGGRSLAYIWKLRNFEPRRLETELQRLEAMFGPETVRGRAPPESREIPVEAPVARSEERIAPGPAPAEPERPMPSFLAAHALLGQEPERRRRAAELTNQALELLHAERFEAALKPLEEVVGIWRELAESERLRAALADWGTALFRLSRYDAALTAWREAEALSRQSGDRAELARCLGDQARALAAGQEWTAALERLREQEGLLTPADREALVHCLGFQGWILAGQQRRGEAVTLLERQATLLRALDDRARLAAGLLKQVELLLLVGEPGLARARAEESAALFASLDRPADEAKARALLLKTRIGRPTPLKGVVVLIGMLAPAAVGIGLGLSNPWLWILGVPLVLVSVFVVMTSVSPRLRQAIEDRATKSLTR